MRQQVFDLPPQLLAVMASQLGTFTAPQAYAAGLNHSEIQRLRAAKVLMSVRRGVYVLREAHLSQPELDCYRAETKAALLVLKEPSTLSHVTAGVWSGLPLLHPDLRQQHVTRPDLPASRLEAGIHHHPGALPDGHWLELNGVRLTTDARTAVDIARRDGFSAGLAAVDSALRRGTTREELLDVYDFCRAWAGSRAASRAVTCGDGDAANPGESFARAMLVEAGVAPTGLQVPVVDGDGLVGYADFGWLPALVLGEFDGRLKYGGDGSDAGEVVWREKVREDRLRAAGYEVVRWTWADLAAPAAAAARVRAALARAAVRRAPGA